MEERLVKGTIIALRNGEQHEITKVHEWEEDTFGQGKYLYITDNDEKLAFYRREFEIIRTPVISNTVVISAFPCCGKTYAYKHQDEFSVLDIDSADFSECCEYNPVVSDRVESYPNPEFPKNYIKCIKDNIGKVDVIFVSSHLVVREALEEAGIRFCTVYPKESMLNEWVGRMYRRGSSKEFIKFQIDHWDEFMKNLINEPTGFGVNRLGNNEYIDLTFLRWW